MQGLIGPLKELAEFEELCKNKKKDVGMIRVCGCVNSQKSHMMLSLIHISEPTRQAEISYAVFCL